ncbi:MAG: DUF4364 family protein [Roseburia sp.]|nr:DUF4364 family protein [Roseburia sp.]
MAEPNTVYRITMLAMLDKVDFPLSNTQISNFFLDRDYTDYFTIQQVLSGLLESGLIREEDTFNSTRYSITDEGRKTLSLLSDKLNPDILADLIDFFQENKIKFRNDNSVSSNYYKAIPNGFDVRCQLKGKNTAILDVTLHVTDIAQAKAICENWKKNYMDVYACLVDTLIQ